MKLNYIDDGNEFDFGKVSDEYAKYRDIYPKSMYDKLISFGIGKQGQNILDLGSGTAVLPINLYHTGANFTSTDISENQIAYGQKLAEQKGMNINFKVCSAENTGFESNHFDVVTAVQCFHYFDSEKAAKEIHRVLKSNGLILKSNCFCRFHSRESCSYSAILVPVPPNRFNLKHSLKNISNHLKYYNFYFKIMLVGLFQ